MDVATMVFARATDATVKVAGLDYLVVSLYRSRVVVVAVTKVVGNSS